MGDFFGARRKSIGYSVNLSHNLRKDISELIYKTRSKTKFSEVCCYRKAVHDDNDERQELSYDAVITT
jgi:hypothetical protein